MCKIFILILQLSHTVCSSKVHSSTSIDMHGPPLFIAYLFLFYFIKWWSWYANPIRCLSEQNIDEQTCSPMTLFKVHHAHWRWKLTSNTAFKPCNYPYTPKTIHCEKLKKKMPIMLHFDYLKYSSNLQSYFWVLWIHFQWFTSTLI